MGEKKVCFVIAPIGEEGSEVRKRSDQILKYIIAPATAECGYKAERADSSPRPGLITKQIIDLLIDAPLVIADLTQGNPNVFYELAVRHAVKKPFVHIIDREAGIPFDIGPMRVVRVTHQDLAQADKAREELVQHIKAAETDPEALENPISTTVELRGLRQSDRSSDQVMAEILESVQRIERLLQDERATKAVLQTAQGQYRGLLTGLLTPEGQWGQTLVGEYPGHKTPPTDVSGGPKSS